MNDIKQWVLGMTIAAAAVVIFVALITSAMETKTDDPLPRTGIISEIPMSADLQRYVKDVCSINDIDPLVVLAIIERESCYQPQVVNPVIGCTGLMQLSPETLKWIETQTGCEYNPFVPEQNIAAGVYLLRWHLDHFENDLPKALLAYAKGIGTATKMLREGVDPTQRWEYTTIVEIRERLAEMQPPEPVSVKIIPKPVVVK